MNLTPTLECLDYRIEDQCIHYGRFSIGPIRRGQGITVGNSLRRILISELPGIAITGVEFLNPGSTIHEFSTLPGVRESVFEILLHLKNIIICQTDPTIVLEPQKCLLHLQGPGTIKANSIQLPPTLKLVNPNQYIATLYSEDTTFDLNLTIEYGQGLQWIDSIPVESSFVPVKKVNYIIEDYEVSDSEVEKRERIVLEVWTNGSLAPKDAIHQGTQLLIDLFSPLLELKEPAFLENSLVTPLVLHNNQQQSKISNHLIDTKQSTEILIEDLGLSVRSYNCLKSAHIHTVSDLLDYSQENLLEIKNFGLKSAEEVAKALQNHLGIELPK